MRKGNVVMSLSDYKHIFKKTYIVIKCNSIEFCLKCLFYSTDAFNSGQAQQS